MRTMIERAAAQRGFAKICAAGRLAAFQASVERAKRNTPMFRFSIMGSMTIAERLRQTAKNTSGFDYLRILLAISVIVVHSWVTSYGAEGGRAIWVGWSRPFVAIVLPMFFALSGFLVVGSLLRSQSILEFLSLRAIRIAPALFVEVTIGALILGPLLTSFTLGQYFSDPKFISYGLNVFGDIQYKLPGLFLNNPDPDMVNRQLWTIPAELECYLLITILAIVGVVRRPKLFLLFSLGMVVFMTAYKWESDDLYAFDNVPLRSLMLAFLFGIAFFRLQDHIRLNAVWLIAAIVLSYVCLYFRSLSYVATIPIAYLTVYLGLLNPRKTILNYAGDYSYGLYLYGYPVQQTFVYLFPDLRIWWVNSIVCVAVGLCFAAFSWHLVESRVLGQKAAMIKKVRSLVAAMTATRQRLLSRRPQAAE